MNLKSILAVFFISSLSGYVWAAPCSSLSVELKHNSWTQISLPCDPRANATVAKIFGGAIKTALGGRDGELGVDWAVYKYENGYEQLNSESEMEQGMGYWIIQATGGKVEFNMPEGSGATRTGSGFPEVSFQGIALNTKSNSNTWNMVGNPFAVRVANVYVSYDSQIADDCPTIEPGCKLSVADRDGIVHKNLYRYNSDSGDYDLFDENTIGLNPWDGFWVATLNKAKGDFPFLMVTRPTPVN